MYYLANFSGGKDSTAMLLYIIENNLPLDGVMFCDTGAEFAGIYKNIKYFQKLLTDKGIDFFWIRPKHSLLFMLTKYKKVRGKFKGLPYTWPTPRRRWCTFQYKVKPWLDFILKNLSGHDNIVVYTGYNAEEKRRANVQRKYKTENMVFKYPLIEANINSESALSICYNNGVTFNGLYDVFRRASCWMCPLKTKKEHILIKEYFPKYWEWILNTEDFFFRHNLPGWKFTLRYSAKEL